MLGGFGLAGKERSKRNVVGARLARLHRQMAAGVTGYANLCLAPQTLARLVDQPVLLPQMNAVGTQSPGQCDAVVDEERAVGIPANSLEWLGELGRFVLVDPFDAELECRDWPRPKRTCQPIGKGTADIERRDQIKLAGGVWHGRASNAVASPSQAFRNGSFAPTIMAGMKPTPMLLAPLALAGCVTASMPAPSPDESGLAYARMGQTIETGGPRVTPLALLEDSRCPQGVQCVWAGRVRINATISTPTMKLTRALTLGEPFNVTDGTLTLIGVRPDKRKDTPIQLADYHFSFRFNRGH